MDLGGTGGALAEAWSAWLRRRYERLGCARQSPSPSTLSYQGRSVSPRNTGFIKCAIVFEAG
jgi:hypothetical protein